MDSQISESENFLRRKCCHRRNIADYHVELGFTSVCYYIPPLSGGWNQVRVD